jgi:hypothetical protein
MSPAIGSRWSASCRHNFQIADKPEAKWVLAKNHHPTDNLVVSVKA